MLIQPPRPRPGASVLRCIPSLFLVFVLLVTTLVPVSAGLKIDTAVAASHTQATESPSIVLAPWCAPAADDVLWAYQDGTWNRITPPRPGVCWRWLAANPFDRDQWLLLGNSGWGSELAAGNTLFMHNTTVSPLWYTADAGATWTPITLPVPPPPVTDPPSPPYTIGDWFTQVEWSDSAPGYWHLTGFVTNRWGTDAAVVYRGTETNVVVQSYMTWGNIGDIEFNAAGADDDVVVAAYERGGYVTRDGNFVLSAKYGWPEKLQIERLPGTSRALVGVRSHRVWPAGGNLYTTGDYRAAAPAFKSSIAGYWITAATDGVYVGGRTGVLRVTDPLAQPQARWSPPKASR